MLCGHVALTIGALFTGAALYINVAEQPARLVLDDPALLRQWKPAYKRGFAMQATLAIAGFVCGAAAWWVSGSIIWLAGALVLVANWPFTLLAIMPVNNQLLSMDATAPGPSMRPLSIVWGRLHAVRSALGAVSTALFLWALQVT